MGGGEFARMTSDATHLYWVLAGEANEPGFVRRMPLVGGPIENLAVVPLRLYSLAVADGFVYYTATHDARGDFTGAIYKIPITGGTPTVIATELNPTVLSIDGGWIYYNKGFSPGGQILRVPIAGGEPEVVACDVDNPWDLVARDGVVYYAEMNRGRMMRSCRATRRACSRRAGARRAG